MKVISEIIKAIKASDTFFIAGHVKPDGDTVGTGLALLSMLRRLGKKAELYSLEPIPQSLSFIKGSKKIRITDKAPGRFDCAIILECLNLERMGNLITKDQAKILVNIDHHASFTSYGNINYIDSCASSSAELVYDIFKQIKMPLLKEEARALYVALVTDTGRFQQANATPKALRMAAELLEAGVVPTEIYNNLYSTQTLPALNLLGESLATLKTIHENRISYLEVTNRMYAKTGATSQDTEGIINHSMMIPGVVMSALFRETGDPGMIKVSMRSKDSFSVGLIAKHFGGGGHKNASGCSIRGNLRQVEDKLLKYVKKFIK